MVTRRKLLRYVLLSTCVGCFAKHHVSYHVALLLTTSPSAGIGFGKHNNRGVIHLYRWTAENSRVAETRLEIDAHENGVHDLALTNLDGSLVAVSGGGDCRVKVWSATTGQLMFCFVGAADFLGPASLRQMICQSAHASGP